jgi:hypothetical protein
MDRADEPKQRWSEWIMPAIYIAWLIVVLVLFAVPR